MRKQLAFYIAAVAAALSGPAFAQDVINPDGVTESDGTQIVVSPTRAPAKPADIAPAPQADAATIQIDEAACRYATRHVPSPDTDYKPGADVNGNAVAPADIGEGARIQFPSRFAIPVTTNLAQRLNLPSGFREDAFVGLITVDGGKLSFNGQPIGDDDDAELAVMCRSRRSPEQH